MQGDTSASSLLRAAQTAYNRRLALEDDIAAYEFSLSAKTDGDLQRYVDHLSSRVETSSDPSKQLSYTKKISSARRTYISHEIQRSTIEMLETGAPLTQKRELLGSFYRSAISNGDMDLAQSLRLQYDRLDIQIQNEQEAAARQAQSMAEKMSRAQSVTFEDYAEKLLSGTPDLSREGAIPSIAQIDQIFKDKGSDYANEQLGNMWDVLQDTAIEAAEALQMAAQFATAPSKQESLMKKANSILNGGKAFKVGGMSLSIEDFRNAADTRRNGFDLFEGSQRVDDMGNVVNVLEKSKITDFVWGRDKNNNLRIIPTRNLTGDDFGDANDPTSATARLEASGYEVLGLNEDGTLQVRATANVRFAPQLPEKLMSEGFSVVLDDNGNARVVSEGPESGIYQITLNPEDPNELGQFSAVDPETDFAKYGQRFQEAIPGEVRAFNEMLQESQRVQEERDRTFDATGSLEQDETALDTILGVGQSVNDLDFAGVAGPGADIDSLLMKSQATGLIRDELNRKLEVAAAKSVEQAAKQSTQRLQRTSGQNIQGSRAVADRVQAPRQSTERLQQTVGHNISQTPAGRIGQLQVRPVNRRQNSLRVR